MFPLINLQCRATHAEQRCISLLRLALKAHVSFSNAKSCFCLVLYTQNVGAYMVADMD